MANETGTEIPHRLAGQAAAPLKPDQTAAAPLVVAAEDETGHDAAGDWRLGNSGAIEAHRIEDVGMVPEMAEDRQVLRRAIDRATPVMSHSHVLQLRVDPAQFTNIFSAAIAAAIEPCVDTVPVGNAAGATPKDDHALWGALVVEYVMLGIADRGTARPS